MLSSSLISKEYSRLTDDTKNIAVSEHLHGILKLEATRRGCKLYELTEAVLNAWVAAGCPNVGGLT